MKAPSLKVPGAPKVPKLPKIPGLGLLAKFRWAMPLLGLVAFGALVWYGGPFIAIGTLVPLEGVTTRIVVILVVVLAVVALALFRLYRRHRANAALAEGIAGASDEAVLTERMADAIATLKQSAGGRGADPLYVLPWYIIIGPSGAGKTTALVHSGLKFPLTEGDTPINGIGGTRYCDWWFHDEAVLVDTAGRLSTHDSNPDTDRRSWLSFLELLSNNRPRQPINGVVVAMSLQDLLDPAKAAQVETDTTAIRKRLAELHDSLKIDFPVYVWFTKADLIAGFSEFFADLDEAARRQVWGVTFQTSDRRANMISKAPGELELLIQRVGSRVTQRLDEEPDPRSRAILFGFPSQLLALQKPVLTFLNRVFEPTRFHAHATLRGFYFVSGTQEGNPLDQVVGALARSFGVVESRAASAYSGTGRSYFLHDVLKRVIFPEAGWVSTNIAAVRRARGLRIAAFSLIAVLTAGIGAAWATSFINNRNLIQTFTTDARNYVGEHGTAAGTTEVVNSPDLTAIHPALIELNALRNAMEADAPFTEGFGLGQRGTFTRATEAAYRSALEHYFRPRLLLRLEEALNESEGDFDRQYEILKVYLLLGSDAPKPNNELIQAWFENDWAEQFPFEPAPRADLAGHLEEMLKSVTGRIVSADPDIITHFQRILARSQTPAERAYALLRASAPNFVTEKWEIGGIINAANVFAPATGTMPIEDLGVDPFFTRDGFHLAFLDRIPIVTCLVNNERWVLGDARPATQADNDGIEDALLQLYGADFVEAWTTVLNNTTLQAITSPGFLARLVVTASPLTALVEAVARETALTAEDWEPSDRNREHNESPTGQVNDCQQVATRLGATQLAPADADFIQEQFDPLRAIPMDRYLELIDNIVEAAADADAAPANAPVVTELNDLARTLRTEAGTRIPPWFAAMMTDIADYAQRQDRTANEEAIGFAFTQLVEACRTVVYGPETARTGALTFPFGTDPNRPAQGPAFNLLFQPNGQFDQFFNTYLATVVDTRSDTWRWLTTDGVQDELISAQGLAQFRNARAIRDAMFSGQPEMSFQLVVTLQNPSPQFELTMRIGGEEVGPMGRQTGADRQSVTVAAGDVTITAKYGLLNNRTALASVGSGAWGLFQALSGPNASRSGSQVIASFEVGAAGTVRYAFDAPGGRNPLTMTELRSFRCPG